MVNGWPSVGIDQLDIDIEPVLTVELVSLSTGAGGKVSPLAKTGVTVGVVVKVEIGVVASVSGLECTKLVSAGSVAPDPARE